MPGLIWGQDRRQSLAFLPALVEATALVIKFQGRSVRRAIAACLRPHGVTVGVGHQVPGPLGKAGYRRLPSPQKSRRSLGKPPTTPPPNQNPLGKPHKPSPQPIQPPKTKQFRQNAPLPPAKPRTQPIANAISEQRERTTREPSAAPATEPQGSQAKRRRPNRKRSASKRTIGPHPNDSNPTQIIIGGRFR